MITFETLNSEIISVNPKFISHLLHYVGKLFNESYHVFIGSAHYDISENTYKMLKSEIE